MIRCAASPPHDISTISPLPVVPAQLLFRYSRLPPPAHPLLPVRPTSPLACPCRQYAVLTSPLVLTPSFTFPPLPFFCIPYSDTPLDPALPPPPPTPHPDTPLPPPPPRFRSATGGSASARRTSSSSLAKSPPPPPVLPRPPHATPAPAAPATASRRSHRAPSRPFHTRRPAAACRAGPPPV
jgi:hypothetical protein